MAKKSLQELKKLSVSALRHAELTSLARDENLTPNQVQEHATNLRWPTRLAKAARFLAILRRDYGLEALDAFITTTEHARSERSETEHAREKEKMEDSIRRAIARMPGNSGKLKLMIKQGLREDLEGLLTELITNTTITLRDNFHLHAGGEVILERPDGSREADNKSVYLVVSERGDLSRDTLVHIDFEGLCNFFNWSTDEIKLMARVVLQKIMDEPPKEQHTWFLRPMEILVSNYFETNEEFAIKTKLWIATMYIRCSAPFEINRHVLRDYSYRRVSDRQQLDAVVDHLRNLGMSDQQICDLLIERATGENGERLASHGMQNVLALLGAKCFNSEQVREQRSSLLRKHFLAKAWKECFGDEKSPRTPIGWQVDCLRELGKIGLWKRAMPSGMRHYRNPDDDLDFIRARLVEMLSVGRLSLVFQLLLMFEHEWGLIYSGTAKDCVYGMLPDAFMMAYESSRYGTASALSQHFGQDAVINKQVIDKFKDQAIAHVDDDLSQLYEVNQDLFERREEIKAEGRSEALAVFDATAGEPIAAVAQAIDQKQDAKFAELKAERLALMGEVLQLAIALEQPIKLEVMVLMIPSR